MLNLDDNENLFLPEDSYTGLKEPYQSLGFMEQMALSKNKTLKVRAVKDNNGQTVCLAVHNPETEDYPSFWAVFSNLVAGSGTKSKAYEQFNHLAAAILDTSDDVTILKTAKENLAAALREYFSLSLVNRQLCDGCVKGPETYDMIYFDIRIQRLMELFARLGSRFDPKSGILEICCGNGMATLSLEKLGIMPLTLDYDRCQVCQGLEHGVLKPQFTMVMDATRLTDFFPENSFDTVIGFMLGTIYSFNRHIWTAIMEESFRVVRPGGQLLFTVNKQEEMDILTEALNALEVKGEVIDNTDENGIYDQWVYLGQKI